jgi:hypothetical protein
MTTAAFFLSLQRLDSSPLAPFTHNHSIDIHNPLHSCDCLCHREIDLLPDISSHNLVGLRIPLFLLYLLVQTEKPFILLKYLLIRFDIHSSCVVFLGKSAPEYLREWREAVKINISSLLLVRRHPSAVINCALLGVTQSLVRPIDKSNIWVSVQVVKLKLKHFIRKLDVFE